MKKGQIAEGNVTTVEFPNKGIVMTDEGERVIVKNTIPGQRVSFAVNKVRKGKAEGRLLETVKKSPRETADTCRHFGQCGGCTYQSLPYEEQLKIKETQVRGMIEQAIGDACAYEFLPIRHSPRVLAYRNKMEFSFGDEYKDGPLALVTPHAAVVDLNDIPHWCRGFLKECKVHIVIIQLCTQKQWTDNHTPSSCLIGKFHGVRHFSRGRFFYGKIKK